MLIHYCPEKLLVSSLIEVEMVYKDINHPDNYFIHDGITLYREKAQFLLHKIWKDILDKFVEFIPDGYCLRLYDALRIYEAQKHMRLIADEKKYHDSLVSSAGQGAHPRGLALDCALVKKTDGYAQLTVDYGTGFDEFTMVDSHTGYTTDCDNPNAIPLAGRNTKFISSIAKNNRLLLEITMQKAALTAGYFIMPLFEEWWDFRFPKNESDLKYILSSFHRILWDDHKNVPNINTYEEFCEYWREYFAPDKVPVEKKHIFGDLLPKEIPSKKSLVFYEDYPVYKQKDIEELGFIM